MNKWWEAAHSHITSQCCFKPAMLHSIQFHLNHTLVFFYHHKTTLTTAHSFTNSRDKEKNTEAIVSTKWEINLTTMTRLFWVTLYICKEREPLLIRILLATRHISPLTTPQGPGLVAHYFFYNKQLDIIRRHKRKHNKTVYQLIQCTRKLNNFCPCEIIYMKSHILAARTGTWAAKIYIINHTYCLTDDIVKD